MDNILSALQAIPASSVSYQEWISIGMALRSEGYSCEVWDAWSRNDSRYHTGECERKWRTFKGSSDPVTGATLIRLAKEYGWKPFEGNGLIDWDGEILYDGNGVTDMPKVWSPAEELKRYLELLFEPDDLVSYVTESWKDSDGKWKPAGTGSYDRTAGQLISALKKYPDDLGAAMSNITGCHKHKTSSCRPS